MGSSIGVTKGEPRSLDYSSHESAAYRELESSQGARGFCA